MFRSLVASSAALVLTLCFSSGVAAQTPENPVQVCGDRKIPPAGRIRACTQVLAQNPQDAAALRARGIARDEGGDRESAIADFDEVIRLKPEDGAAFYDRAVAWAAKGDTDKAMADYDRAIALDPANYYAFNNRGVLLKMKRNFDRAIADFSEAYRLKPDYLPALFNRGITYSEKSDKHWREASPQEKHDIERALADFDELVKRATPPSGGVYYRRALTRQRREGSIEAIMGDFDMAISISPDFVDARMARAEFMTKWDHYIPNALDRAAADCDHVIGIQPRSLRAYYQRALIWTEKGNAEKAIADYSAAIGIKPVASLYLARARLQESRGRSSEARADLDAAVNIDGQSGEAREARAWFRKRSGDEQGAIEDLSAAVAQRPSAGRYLDLGMLYNGIGDDERAMSNYNRSLQLYADFGLAYVERARLFLKQRRLQAALEDAEHALRVPVVFARAHQVHGEVLAAMGRNAEAVAAYRAALAKPGLSRQEKEEIGLALTALREK